MTPSNANTSGLTQDLCERLDAILVEESPMHPFGCATWEEASRVAIDMAKEVIVTAASAQARIAELEAERDAERRQVTEMRKRNAAMKGRADRLAKALEPFASLALDEANDVKGVSMSDPISKWLTVAQLVDARAALQQETQP